jgi:hypothetical protein
MMTYSKLYNRGLQTRSGGAKTCRPASLLRRILHEQERTQYPAAQAGRRAGFQTLGAIASALLAVSFIGGPYIYLVGNVRDAHGPVTYHLADLLSGPAWGASLVTAILALRERIGERASAA